MKKIFYLALCVLILSSCDYVHQFMNSTIDFESVGSEYLAGPTAAGENLYSNYDGTQFKSVTVDGIVFGINASYSEYNFYNGGICISRFDDMSVDDYTNQCSVYYQQNKTGFGGYQGSKTFAVANGYNSDNSNCPCIYFLDDDQTAQFVSMQVTNTTYAYQTMANGNDYCRKLSYDNKDYLKVVATGYATDGSLTGTTEFYLADFRTSSSEGIVTNWKEVSLTGLGSCHKIDFDIQGSDTGDYGLNTPAYFCFDNLVYKKD
ncbi:MAG: DUF4465 domain-containing protein [Bacteroidales bacterium]|jgi:hypothetical protein|nr:DUF4465 domain-containing protein [Bacteroidales bacterium]MCI2144868.1 DUF4465 domain-containing protein [Bacteroidales bacterium]